MLKLIKFAFVLFLGVISCACVNIVAVHELNQKASDYLNEGNVEAAISRLEASVDLDGSIYESRYNLASAYIMVGEYKKALTNIEAAIPLAKDEPAVYYTHGVSSMHVADGIYETKDENGEMVEVTFKSPEKELEAAQNYIDLLTKANKSFDKYTTLAPNAEDTQQVLEIIQENKDKIAQKEAQYNIKSNE